MADHPHAISLEQGDKLSGESYEVARVWITNGAGSSVWIDPGILDEPEIFGFLIADTVRHAARAYAARYALPEEEALQRIVDGIGEELREQFTEITTLKDGSLN